MEWGVCWEEERQWCSGARKFVWGRKGGTVSSGEIKRRSTIEWEGADQRIPWTTKHGEGRGLDGNADSIGHGKG